MDKIKITGVRKRILVFWWFYHKRELLWPSLREAAEELDVSHVNIRYHTNLLIEKEWMNKKGHQIGLSHYGFQKMQEAEDIALGKKPKRYSTVDPKFLKSLENQPDEEKIDIFERHDQQKRNRQSP